MGILSGLEPEPVFRYFEEICGIPHTSHHEKALSDYCVRFAKERGYECEQDEMGNVLIIAEATQGYEDVPPVIVQGHLDMVGDKAKGCEIDMGKEGLRLLVEDGCVRADKTTLGGDDGVAVAYALALLDATDGSIPHPRLEIVLTVCEEVGLLGATAMDLSSCKARRLLNIDSEVEGVLTVGCAGGIRIGCHIPVERENRCGLSCKLELTGLMGGHSGTEIDKGRANAAALLGRFLMFLKCAPANAAYTISNSNKDADDFVPYGLASFSSGVKENVIPKSASAEIVIKQGSEEALFRAVDRFRRDVAAEYGTADPDIHLELALGESGNFKALDQDSLCRVLVALNLMPNGIQTMSANLPGLVETSANLGIAELKENELTLYLSARSSIPSAKEMLCEKVASLTSQLGGDFNFQGDYPAWPYAKDSKLRELCVEIFKEQYGHDPEVKAIHAGLECGILSSKLEGLDCISFGPDLFDIHTPNERLDIASTARVWEFLKAILGAK